MSSATNLTLMNLPKTPKELESSQIEKQNYPCLPTQLMLRVFSYLDILNLSKCSLVNHQWKRWSSDKTLWKNLIAKFDISQWAPQTYMGVAWKYRDLALSFSKSFLFGAAITCCETGMKHGDSIGGPHTLRDICRRACQIKDYKTALECQQLAKQLLASAGNLAMSDIIHFQTRAANFLENSEKLIESSLNLIEEDRDLGLEALVTIAKKFASLQMFDKAMQYTQLATNVRDSKKCSRSGEHIDIQPFREMGKHMLSLNQCNLAEECAKKIGRNNFAKELFADIIIKQIQEENFINERLLAEIEFDTIPWERACEGLVFGLIDKARYEEAQKIANLRLQSNFGNSRFTEKLRHKLMSLGMFADH
jgi:hypothetical protein